MNRDTLYERINSRVDDMIKQGLLEEVKQVLKMARKNSTALQAIGYKEFIHLLQNNESLEQVKDKIKKNTRNYAKRQYTFFNNQFKMKWINLDDYSEEAAIIIIEKAFKGETNV
jgi:tRNA dimethylallyltransferase